MGKAKAPKAAVEAGQTNAGEAIDLVEHPTEPGQFSLGSQSVGDLAAGGGGESPAPEVHFINIQLKDDKGNPVGLMPSGAPVKFRITVAGQTYEGALNALGRARVDGLPEANCEVSFPEIDASEWS